VERLLKPRTRVSTFVKPSVVGSKGFLYPDSDATGYMIQKGTEFDLIPYLGGGKAESLQAVLIENCKVSGAPIDSGISLYWIKKDLVEK
jgi:hypothetical protein